MAVVLAAWFVPGRTASRRAARERNAAAALKSIAAAQADFRLNDRDGNGIQDFWTADVAGLAPRIPPEVATADPSTPQGRPYHGYWFMPLELDQDGKPYRPDGRGRHPSRFAFCAYPDSPS